jgi:hypothetical protein
MQFFGMANLLLDPPWRIAGGERFVGLRRDADITVEPERLNQFT